MMFSPILVGFQFKFLFNDNVGLINNALQSLGVTQTAIPWLIDGNLAFLSILVAEVLSSTPVFAILILAGLLAMLVVRVPVLDAATTQQPSKA